MPVQTHQHDSVVVCHLRIVRIETGDAPQHLLCLGDAAGARQQAAQKAQRQQRIRCKFGRRVQRIDRRCPAAHAVEQHAATNLQGRVERSLLARHAQPCQLGVTFVSLDGHVHAVQDIIDAVGLQPLSSDER
jgi:hypothetical protein